MPPRHYHPTHIARCFNKAASHYDHHAFIQNEVGRRLLKRLNCISFSPCYILDLGSGTGTLTRELRTLFPNSIIVGLDLAYNMIQQALQSPLKRSIHDLFYLCADMNSLPFKDQSFDLIFSNFTLQWANDLSAVFAECKRLLSPKGMLFFTTLGPDTLYELRHSFAAVDHYQHIHPFYDLHDIGDMLLHCAFQDPVVDKENITLCYDNVLSLLKDLKGVGSTNFSSLKSSGCMTPHFLQKIDAAYEQYKNSTNHYPATYEIIYGHALSPALHRRTSDGLIHIPGNKIPIIS